jgi:hypothetical protein
MHRRFIIQALAATAALVPAGFAGTSVAQTASAPTVDRYLVDSRIVESSGLETARHYSNILYTHNDSGDIARFFAVGADGLTKALFTLQGAGARDWEDMSAGPGASLWFADIGDNNRLRTYVSVFRVPEPTKLVSANVPWTRFDFRYADGLSHNAEALLVNPVTGVLYIATKQSTGAAMYRAPLPLKASGYNQLTRIANAPPVVTGGDFSQDAQQFVLRTSAVAHVYRDIGGSASAVPLPIGGESVAFTRDNAALLVGKEGSNSPVWRVPLG